MDIEIVHCSTVVLTKRRLDLTFIALNLWVSELMEQEVNNPSKSKQEQDALINTISELQEYIILISSKLTELKQKEKA